MPFPKESSIRVRVPHGYKRYRRKSLADGVDVIMGVTKAGESEIQSYRFDESKFTPDRIKEYMSVGEAVVRTAVKNVSELERNHREDITATYGNLYGQSGPGEGMGYIKTPVMNASNPQDDVPAGNGDRVLAMPQPRVADPKGSLTNIIPGQAPRIDSPDTLAEEDVTYGDLLAEQNGDELGPDKPRYGLQRSIPSAYAEVIYG